MRTLVTREARATRLVVAATSVAAIAEPVLAVVHALRAAAELRDALSSRHRDGT
jgi:hypothetical protein